MEEPMLFGDLLSSKSKTGEKGVIKMITTCKDDARRGGKSDALLDKTPDASGS